MFLNKKPPSRFHCCWRIVMITRRQFNATASAALLVPSVSAVGARAATWPTRAVRIIVPFAAGGPTDVIGRMVGEAALEELGPTGRHREPAGRRYQYRQRGGR